MPVTPLSPLNAPVANDIPDDLYQAKSYSMTLANEESQICYLPGMGAFHPPSVLFSATGSGVELEVSGDSEVNISAGTGLFVPVTITSAFMSISSMITAIRVTNTTGSSLTVQLCV